MYTPQILYAPLHSVVTDPSTGTRQSFWEWGDGQVEVGIWECEPGTLNGPTGDYDEMMYMVAGRATVTHGDGDYDGDDGDYDLSPATLWVTPRNWPGTWTIHQTVRKLYVIDHRPGGAAPWAHMPNAHVVEVGNTKPRVPIEGDPHESTNVLWKNNGLDVGIWECTPGKFAASRIGYDEVFICLSGQATMSADNGMRFDLAAGSVLYTPAGFTGTWNVTETFRKVYCLINDR